MIEPSGLEIIPNPASGQATLRYDLEGSERVQIEVLSPDGKKVFQANDAEGGPGVHERVLDLKGLSSGVYLVRIQTGAQTLVQKLVVQ
jgi:hypothetical protein